MKSDATPVGLTVREVAKRYRVSPDKVRAWIRRGLLPAVDTSAARSGRPRFVVLPEALATFERGRLAVVPPQTPPRRRRKTGSCVDYYPD